MFTLYTRYTLTTAQGNISEAGIRDIEIFLRSQKLQESEEWKALNPENTKEWLPYLPNNWQWVWIVERGEYAGTMPKRIAKYYFKEHGLKFPQSQLAALGQLARSHSSETKTYTFELANQIDWQDGDFGDGGSCWWGSYSGSRVMWDANNGLSIRFYDESGDGYARAWVMEIDTELYTVMNGYGLSTLQITRIFAQFTGLTYKQIHLHNSASSSLWINGSMGYIVGKFEVINEIESHDFDMEGEDAYTCHSCGRLIDENDRFVGADDNDYCEGCYYEIFDSCEHCGSTHYREDLTYVESAEYDVCEWCLEHNYDLCDKCEEYHRNHQLTHVGEKQYCADCLSDLNTEGENIE